jgi:hypothetical protein
MTQYRRCTQLHDKGTILYTTNPRGKKIIVGGKLDKIAVWATDINQKMDGLLCPMEVFDVLNDGVVETVECTSSGDPNYSLVDRGYLQFTFKMEDARNNCKEPIWVPWYLCRCWFIPKSILTLAIPMEVEEVV